MRDLRQISDLTICILREDCQKIAPGLGALSCWGDQPASAAKRYVRYDLVKDRFSEGRSEADSAFLHQITTNNWFWSTLQMIPALYGLYLLKKSENMFVPLKQEYPGIKQELLKKLTGDFVKIQNRSTSRTKWPERAIGSMDDDAFWREASLVLYRYFEYALDFPNEIQNHFAPDVKWEEEHAPLG